MSVVNGSSGTIRYHHVERLIDEAIDRGEFAELPGTGRPLRGWGTVDDELWWVRSWIERHGSPGSDGPLESPVRVV